MAFLKRRVGAHLSDGAKEALAACRPYPSIDVMRNAQTRAVARRIADDEWRETLRQIDFPYTLDDVEIGGVPCVIYRCGDDKPSPLIFYLHAGAFVCGSARVNAAAVLPTCHLTGGAAIAVNYSLAPEHVWPTQLEEIERVWRALLAEGIDPGTAVMLGDSAGGALAVASLYRWRRLGLPFPAGLVLLSPTLDAAGESDTQESLRGRDPLFSEGAQEGCRECYRLYAGGADVSDPEISPLVGDPKGLPPTMIHVGTREILLGDSARFAEKARRAGVDVSLRVFDGMFHLFHQHWRLWEAKAAHQDLADFVRKVTC